MDRPDFEKYEIALRVGHMPSSNFISVCDANKAFDEWYNQTSIDSLYNKMQSLKKENEYIATRKKGTAFKYNKVVFWLDIVHEIRGKELCVGTIEDDGVKRVWPTPAEKISRPQKIYVFNELSGLFKDTTKELIELRDRLIRIKHIIEE